MNLAHREAILARAVFKFMTQNPGSVIYRHTSVSAFIRTPGLTNAEHVKHGRRVRRSLGLYLPIYKLVITMNQPRRVFIHTMTDGSVVIHKLSGRVHS